MGRLTADAAGNDLSAAAVALNGRGLLSVLALLGALVAFAVFGVLARVLGAALTMIMAVLGAATKVAVLGVLALLVAVALMIGADRPADHPLIAPESTVPSDLAGGTR
jgi:hypothetical protein